MTSLRVTASFCREQEAVNRAKAASEPLENRRRIVLAAAKAWEAEALLMEEREAGNAPLDKLDAEIALGLHARQRHPQLTQRKPEYSVLGGIRSGATFRQHSGRYKFSSYLS
jgi:hypothetical protein